MTTMERRLGRRPHPSDSYRISNTLSYPLQYSDDAMDFKRFPAPVLLVCDEARPMRSRLRGFGILEYYRLFFTFSSTACSMARLYCPSSVK